MQPVDINPWVLDTGNSQTSVTVQAGGRGASSMAGCRLSGRSSLRILTGTELDWSPYVDASQLCMVCSLQTKCSASNFLRLY